MDIKIDSGDIALRPNKAYEEKVSGSDEIFQRIKLILSTKKGSFIYDRDFGADYIDADFSTERNFKLLNLILNEAVADIEGAAVELLSAETTDGRLKIGFNMKYFDDTAYDEVIIDGKL